MTERQQFSSALPGRQKPFDGYICPYTLSSSASAIVANRFEILPICIFHDINIHEIGTFISAGIAGNLVLGIYNWPRGEHTLAELLGQCSPISTAIAGGIVATLVPAIPLSKGYYLLAYNSNVAVSLRRLSAVNWGYPFFRLSSTSATIEVISLYAAFTYTGVLPSNFSGLSFTDNTSTNPPLIIIK